MIFQANGILRKVGVAILILDEINLKIIKVKKDTEGYFIMIEGITHQEDITLINISASNQRAPKCVMQLLTELKRETDQNTTTVGDLNTPLSDLDRSSKQKINKEITSLSDTLHQLDIIDIYRAFYYKAAAHTYFSSARETFSTINHILRHRGSLNKYKKVEIIPTIFSDCNAIKLEISCKKKSERTTNTWSLQHATEE